jgi:hypothetical protein
MHVGSTLKIECKHALVRAKIWTKRKYATLQVGLVATIG